MRVILRDVLKEIAIAVAIVAVPVSWASLAIIVVNDKWPDSEYAAQRVASRPETHVARRVYKVKEKR